MFLLPVIAALTLSGPKIGLALNVPDGGGKDEFAAAMRQQIRLGLDGGIISLKWDEYETQGSKALDDGLNGSTFLGQDCLVPIATLDTVKRRLPEDLKDLPFDDEKVLSRFDAFFTQIAPKLKDHVKWISLGNEVNAYLGAHPDEVSHYLKFLDHGRELVHKLLPDVKVGVTVTCTDGMQNPALVDQLEREMDLSIFTYYPLKGFQAIPPSEVPNHFAFMVKESGDRPLLLQEIGYPSSSNNGSSEALQAEFVKNVFAQIEDPGNHVQLAGYFIQTDFNETLLKFFDGYYGVDQAQFHSFLGSLGLNDNKGKPKTAWAEFCKDCLKLKPIY